jgi:hypothetical protein
VRNQKEKIMSHLEHRKEDRILTKQEVEKRYKVSRNTIENWSKYNGLPLFEVSSNKKFIRESELLQWEEELIGRKKLRNQSPTTSSPVSTD